MKYKIEPTEPFPVSIGVNYVIDLPYKEWGAVANVRLSNDDPFRNRNLRFLKAGDFLMLPNGSWLEVAKDKDDAWGAEGTLYGILKKLDLSDEVIDDKRKEGLVYKTCVSYIR